MRRARLGQMGWAAVAGVLVAGLMSCDGPGTTSDSDVVLKPDMDGDGVADKLDNCTQAANPDQGDLDGDGTGDACDTPPDLDEDGVEDHVDNCASITNVDQADRDADGFGDLCDNCPSSRNADQADLDGDGVGNACPCDACAPGQWCTEHPYAATPSVCADDCEPNRQGTAGVCCPLGSKWYPDAAACLLGDVYVDEERLVDSLVITTQNFSAGDCEIVEGCVNGPGTRKLLRFDTTTPNIGEGDLYLGRPAEVDDIFVYSECHEHFHLETYAFYEVVDALGNVVAPGHKQAFCLMDFEPWASGVAWRDAVYHCGNQGISVGFADTYDSYLDCQFVDITDVPAGDYRLRISVNYEQLLAESNYANNTAEIAVVIP